MMTSISELTRKLVDNISGIAMVLKNVDDAATEVHYDNKNKGFWEEYERTLGIIASSPDNEGLVDKYIVDIKLSKLELITSELAEAAEAIRKNELDSHITDMSGEVVELADAVIRILDYAGAFNLPLSEAIGRKLAYNKGRAYKHGKLA